MHRIRTNDRQGRSDLRVYCSLILLRQRWRQPAWTERSRVQKTLVIYSAVLCSSSKSAVHFLTWFNSVAQGQLILGDYFAVNEDAAKTAEQATELVHWIVSHDRLRKIFDDAQHEKNFKVVVYLLANITRWTTHYLAFCRLLELKVPLRHAAYLRRQDIVDAQLGAEKNKKAINKITATANTQCDLIENNDFWSSLQTVVDDIEPICYATNINQADRTRPDQVLLSFAGLFRHFSSHKNRSVSKGMLARIEKRWAALDQPMFILCLVLNPYEGLDRFGDKAGINVFILNTELLAVPSSSFPLFIH